MRDSKPISVAPYFDVIHRYRLSALGVLAIGISATVSLTLMLHDAYESTATIVVEPAQVAADYVNVDASKVPGTLSVADQLEALANKVFSQKRLEQLIRTFGLYGYQPGKSMEPCVTLLESKLHFVVPQNTIVYEAARPEGRAPGVLKISFEDRDPLIAQRVTQELSDTFVEDGYRERIQRADDTTLFLASQVAQVGGKLAAKDSQIKELEQRYEGSLPQELEPNLAELSHLQDQLSMIDQELTAERVTPIAPGQNLATSPAQELMTLKLKLNKLRSEYSDEYPDVISLKQQIADLRQQIKSDPSASLTGNSESDDAVGAESSRSERQAVTITAQIETLKGRIALTPVHQQELEGLQRDYEAMAAEYHGLLNKKLGAELNESLEKRHQDERLQLLEPASLPRKPIGPNRPALGILGFCLSIAAALALPFGLHFTDTSFKDAEELQREFSLPVVAAIPIIGAPGAGRVGNLRALAASSAGMFVAAAAIWAYTHLL